ncbi:MAG: TlpA family protein disulfide reductase [Bacteroidia bacterium]
MKKLIFTFLTLLIALSGAKGQDDKNTIVAGTSKITGKITSGDLTNKDNITVNITISQPISGEYVKYKTVVDQSGKFSFEVDVETDISLIGLYTSVNPEKSLLTKLTNGGVTNIDVSYGSDHQIKTINVTPAMSKHEMTRGLQVIGEMIEYRPNRAPTPLYDKSTDYFLNYAKTVIEERFVMVDNDPFFSEELKHLLRKDFRLLMYIGHVFDYEGEMKRNFRNTNDDSTTEPVIQKIDKSYFRFLKDFNLNDPRYLQCFTFSEFQKEILQNENLKLPEIGESEIPTWLASVKLILADLVGFDDGPYYAILAANAYARQLNEELKPLTENQKIHIAKYWGNGEIAKILFRKNQKVIELSQLKSPVVVNDIASVADDKVIETILEKYKGKAIFVDLWATWCAPCLDAMQEFRSTKNEFRDKNVAFVYLTNASSPRKLWEEKIKGIGGEHYYLTDSQWYHVMDKFGFEAIPSYLLFNKEGVIINKFTAFPGSEKVKDMIKDLL